MFFYSTIIFLILVQHGDIEINPGPQKKQPKYFSCCHWNVNSLLAHNKISLLTAYNTIHQYDVICISEKFLDSSVPLDDHNLSIQGYSSVWADHSDNVKMGGVCLYFKGNFTLKVIGNSFIALFVKVHSRIKKVLLLSRIDHQVNLVLSLMVFCVILIHFWIILNSFTGLISISPCWIKIRKILVL